jgi:flagellar M-ring protein FliF
MMSLESLKQFLSRLTLGQRLALGTVVVGSILLLFGIAYWAGRPEYALLFGGLSPADASRIVETLQEENIPYQLKESGTAIWVPQSRVYELRLRFAGEGVVSDGPVGYELFDKGTLGMTDFMQRLNYKRALEGELARTIMSLQQVELAKVHLVLPERSPFRETQVAPSASVLLVLKQGARLSEQQIDGITALVAGAVEGLQPENVTVLDARGNLLSNPEAGNPELTLSSTQLKLRQALEAHLTEKGQSMLDRVLGPGNAIVRVAATLNFDQSTTERQLIDPESATVISEERLEETGTAGNGTTANSMVRNYELSRTIERIQQNGGNIQYLTVSVILNQRYTVTEDGSRQARPYSEEEMREVEELVKNAVGFNPERGDRIAIHQTRFDTQIDDQLAQELREQRRQEQLNLYIRYGLMALALGLVVWLLRAAMRRVGDLAGTTQVLIGRVDHEALQAGAVPEALQGKAPTPGLAAGAPEELVMIDDIYTSRLSAEAKARIKAKHLLFEEVQKKVNEKPEEAAEIIRSWMVSDVNA